VRIIHYHYQHASCEACGISIDHLLIVFKLFMVYLLNTVDRL